MRRHLSSWQAFGLALGLMVVATASCSKSQPPISTSQTVEAKGGTYQLGDVKVTVLEGAVAQATKLTASAPKLLTAAEAPLGTAHTVRFDLSLEGDKQPLKPLRVDIPLTGTFAPTGTKPQQALLYSGTSDGTGYRLAPTIVDDKNVLHALVVHLSPKFVMYTMDLDLDADLTSGGLNNQPVPNCADLATAPSSGPVKIGPNSSGWSYRPDSPIKPCLGSNGTDPELVIFNQIDYALSVAATSGVQVASQSPDAQDELIKKIADWLLPDPRIKAYLSPDSTAVAVMPSGSLPAAVELVGSPNTFLAQSAWTAIKFMVGVYTGVNPSKVGVYLDLITSSFELQSCLLATLKISAGSSPSMWDIVHLLIGKCSEKVAEALGEMAKDINAWDGFWNRVFTIYGGAIDGIDTSIAAINGIRLQFNGTMHIEVEKVTPPPPPSDCPTEAQFKSAINAFVLEKGNDVPSKILACEGGYAIGVAYTSNDSGPTGVVTKRNGAWVIYAFYHYTAEQCNKFPPKIRKQAVAGGC